MPHPFRHARFLNRAAARAVPTAQAAAVAFTAALVLGAAAATAAGQPSGGWCGVPTASDQADAVSAFLVHVIYAVPADAPDRFGERLLPILADVGDVETWWQGEDPTRAPRLDLRAGACASTIGRLDLTDLRLPGDGAYYADPAAGFGRLVAAVSAPAAGFRSPEKKYLVYYDGPVERPGICGTSPLGPPRATATSVIYLASACGGDLGAGGAAAAVVAHELLHSLGALPRAHPCAGTPTHACDSAADILYYAVESGALLSGLRLDVGRDDYYGLTGTHTGWWDVRDSPFLEHLDLRPPAPPSLGQLSATSGGSRVTVSWKAQGAPPAALRFRVYRDGALLTDTDKQTAEDVAEPGTTVTYSVRAESAGYLGPVETIRFRVGAGLVDEQGRLIRDTIPPGQVHGLHAVRAGRSVVLRWSPVADTGDLAGYRVLRNGQTFARLGRRTSLVVSLIRAHATWNVEAVDRAGNTGQPSQPVRFP